jgi:hypothetical protein
LFVRVGEHEEAAMQVTKIRIAEANGLVPAGAYFARLATNLRNASERAAATPHRRAKNAPSAHCGREQLPTA